MTTTSANRPKRIYLSGPMSNMPELNFPAFNREADRLRALGYHVVNPVDINPDPGTPWHDCMRSDLIELLSCDCIALLPGWKKSNGAHLEMHVAHRVGMEIVEVDELPPLSVEPSLHQEDPDHGESLEDLQVCERG